MFVIGWTAMYLDLQKTWMSERPGCSKDLDVRKTWMPERPGCPKDLDVRKTWMSGDLDVLGPGCPGTWMSGT